MKACAENLPECAALGDRRGFLYRPAIVCAPVHKRDRNAMTPRHIAPWFACRRDKHNMPVNRLPRLGRPNAIRRAIAKRIVLSFYRQIIRITSLLCPCAESDEVPPFAAYLDACSSVAAVAGRVRIIAARMHRFPCAIETRAGAAMSARRCMKTLHALAAAICGLSVAEICANRLTVVSAVAAAKPNCSAVRLVASLFKHKPFAEARAN